MAQMLCKQVYIRKQQQVLLKRPAKARGVSEADIIRQAIDRQVGSRQERSLPLAPGAWEKARSCMLSVQAEGPLPYRSRRWTREDLYEERPRRCGLRAD